MNGTLADARRWAEGFAPLSPALEGVETVVCAPTLHLPMLHASLPESVRLGAEDVSAYTNGAHTGDVSAAMPTRATCPPRCSPTPASTG